MSAAAHNSQRDSSRTFRAVLIFRDYLETRGAPNYNLFALAKPFFWQIHFASQGIVRVAVCYLEIDAENTRLWKYVLLDIFENFTG